MGCKECGIDEQAISIPDAISAIRTFPRRFREALARFPSDALRRRPDHEKWSALEEAVHAREVLQRLAFTLPMVLDEPGTKLPPFDAEKAAGPWPDWILDPDLALTGIETACDALVRRAEATPWEAWDRTFTVGDNTLPASWIVQHAAHVGSHHLRDIDRIGRLVGAPEDSG